MCKTWKNTPRSPVADNGVTKMHSKSDTDERIEGKKRKTFVGFVASRCFLPQEPVYRASQCRNSVLTDQKYLFGVK